MNINSPQLVRELRSFVAPMKEPKAFIKDVGDVFSISIGGEIGLVARLAPDTVNEQAYELCNYASRRGKLAELVKCIAEVASNWGYKWEGTE